MIHFVFCQNWFVYSFEESKFFPNRVDPFSERDYCAEKLTGSRKSSPTYVKWLQNF